MVGGLQQRPAGLAVGDDVLVELELSAGAKDAAQIGEHAVLVGDRAEHEAGNGGVDALVGERQPIGDAGQYPDRDRCRGGGLGRGGRRVGSGSIAITSATVVG